MTTRHPIVRVFDCHVARPAAAAEYEYLLLRRAATKIYAGTWRMVGGKLKEGETAWEACLRELAEETQLPIRRLLTVPYINRFYEWRHDRINDIPVFVAVTDKDKEPVLDEEHSEACWETLGDAQTKLRWPGQQEGLRLADRLLRGQIDLSDFMEIDLPSRTNTHKDTSAGPRS